MPKQSEEVLEDNEDVDYNPDLEDSRDSEPSSLEPSSSSDEEIQEPVPSKTIKLSSKKKRVRLSPLSRLAKRSVGSKKVAFRNFHRYAIIQKIEHGTSQSSICSKYGFKKQTISDICKPANRLKVKEAVEKYNRTKQAKYRKSMFDPVYEELRRYHTKIESQGGKLNGDMLIVEANLIAATLGITSPFSTHHLATYKNRFGITLKAIVEELVPTSLFDAMEAIYMLRKYPNIDLGLVDRLDQMLISNPSTQAKSQTDIRCFFDAK